MMNPTFKMAFSGLIIMVVLLFSSSVSAANNIEFLDKQLIKDLNFGVYEIVTPKLEGNKITYARKLPFDKLDFVERNEKYYSIGTAFFINEKELMTAAHVFRLMYFSLLHDFYIRDAAGNVFPVNNILKHSTRRDMVIFDLKKYPAKINPLQIDGNVEIGDTVFSVGNAQGEGIAYRAGQIASFTPEREYGEWKNIRFTSPASPGNSGGPLLNLQGEVVGLIIKKNQSENYNIAVPINEAANLTSEASFHFRNVPAGIFGVDQTVTRDWFFSVKTPASVKTVAESGQDSLNNHWISVSDELMDKVVDSNYPQGVRFRNYIRSQALVKGLSTLVPDKNFRKWRVVGWEGEKIPITADQNVYKSSGTVVSLHAAIEKPIDLSLEQFLDSPKIVMETLLKAVPFSRNIANESIPITSLGEPESKDIVADLMGRKWIVSLWDLPYVDRFVYSACLPYPKGAICLIDQNENSARKNGYLFAIQDAFAEFVVEYSGEIHDWVEFFTLGDKYQSEFFKGSSLTMQDNILIVELPDFRIDFNNDQITASSNLNLYLGYANNKLLAEDLLRLELYPVKGARPNYRIQPFFSPGEFSSDNYKSTWNNVIGKKGNFSGKVINKGGMAIIRQGLDKTKMSFASIHGLQIDKVFATGCYYETSATAIETDCDAFSQSIDFKTEHGD